MDANIAIPHGPTVVLQALDGSTDRSSGVQDVIDEHDVTSCDVEWNVRRTDLRIRERSRRVVPIEGDVDRAHRRRPALDSGDLGSNARRQSDTPPPDADQRESFDPRGRLQDRHGDTADASLNGVGVEDDLLGFSHGPAESV